MKKVIKKIIRRPFNYLFRFFVGSKHKKLKIGRKRVELYELLLKLEKILHNSNELIFDKLERPVNNIERFKEERFVPYIVKMWNEINN